MSNNKKEAGKISASLMCANLEYLKEYLHVFQEEKIEYLHIDIMDGHFVPNLALGTDYLSCIRKMTTIPLDIHLMILNPEERLEWFNLQSTDMVSIHFESTYHVQQTLDIMKSKYGCKTMVAINPATSIHILEDVLDYVDGILVMTINPGFAGRKLIKSTISKVEKLRSYLDEQGYENLIISVDGNMNYENAKIMRDRGADIFIAGSSSIFQEGDIVELIRSFRKCIE
jgi:ribulose-phosphate 3-epimerase